jgi:DNA polymerase-3 subunit delta
VRNVRYDNLRAFEKHLEGAAPQHFSSLYFIVGKDLFECQRAIHLILRFLLPSQSMRELALSTFEGSQVEETKLEQALYSRSFFTKSQVIWIKQAEKLKKSIQESLEKYFIRPQPGQYLLLSAMSWQKNTSFYKMIEREGVILDIAEIKSWEKEKYLAEWVNKQATAARKLMSYQNCQLLVKHTGHDQALLEQEIEKLICYCGERKEITAQDIKAICSHQHADSIWQLGEALFRRDTATALLIVQALLVEGQAVLPLLRQIRAQFQTEYQICLLLAQGKQAQEITQEFPYMKGQILDRHIQQAQQYGVEAFKQGLLALDAAEMRAKNSSMDERLLIELLIMQLTASCTTYLIYE